MFTISDLKKELGPGLGLRKSKYLLEVPVPATNGKKLNILCRSTALPERTISTTPVFHLGRKYNVRAETAFDGSYTISIVDDSKMTIRALFDAWLSLVDQTKPKEAGLSGKTGSGVDGLISAASTLSTSFEGGGESFALNAFDGGSGYPKYQTDVSLWQLGNRNQKVYGYKLQNAYPTKIGTVELDDSDENTLSEFSIDFTYSELIPLKNGTPGLLGDVLGTTDTSIANSIDSLF